MRLAAVADQLDDSANAPCTSTTVGRPDVEPGAAAFTGGVAYRSAAAGRQARAKERNAVNMVALSVIVNCGRLASRIAA
jgi:hypothetical protein